MLADLELLPYNLFMPIGYPSIWDTDSLKHLSDLYQQGYSQQKLVKIFYASSDTIRKRLIELGLPIRVEAQNLRVAKGITRNMLFLLYWDKKMSANEIAQSLGVKWTTVFHWLDVLNIPKRSNSDVAKLRAQKHPQPKGSESRMWKGGIHIEGKYRFIYAPEHYRATQDKPYVAEHIYLWEKAHAKRLPKGWHIHHFNGITTDNRVENLIALPSRQHNFILRELHRRIRELEAENKELRQSRQGGLV